MVFKVQIGTYLRSMKNDKSFIAIKAKEVEINGTFKYYVGNENKKDNKMMNKMMNKKKNKKNNKI